MGVFCSCLVSASPIYKRLIQKLPKDLPTFGIRYMYKKLSTLQDKLKINRHDFIGKVTADIVEFINGLHVLKIYNMVEKRFSKTVTLSSVVYMRS